MTGERPDGEPPPCETFSHVFLECPVVQPAVAWLRGLWGQLGDAPPPLDAQVLVVGDKTVWSPGGGDVWELWTHLRLEFCMAVWRLTARRASTGQAFSATSVVEMTASELERSICLDRGVLADRGDGTLRVHVPRSLPAGS
jgi:hypothetical protein